ncbi:MAG: 2-C-methyl-D-erythritol 4-phosphate cytidylyltransferase [Bacteroidales bacterium]|nr:2-C-methyl-D-erythritol 4-phosphate cytidylyltransferase [Bacteroidales bacterium]
MKHYAIIVAGGSGTRFGSNIPKQFLPLCGRPVLMHTIERFLLCPDTEVVVVLPAQQQDYWRELCHQYEFSAPHSVVSGGDSRFQSVKNALLSLTLTDADIVAVHDGVRPLVSTSLILSTYKTAEQCGAAIPATAVTDSVRQIEADGHSVALERASLRAVQTPQTFKAMELLRAYDVPFSPFFTDDASVYEHAGGKVALVEGETTNIKITHPIDITIAEHIINNNE